MNNTKKNIIYASAWSIFGRILNAFMKFFSVPILLAYYGKEHYGLIGLAMSINVYLRIMEMGFSTGNIRYFSQWISQNRIKKLKLLTRTSISFYGIIGIINLLVLFVIALYSDRFFNLTVEENVIFRKLVFILCFSSIISWSLSVLQHLIRAYEKIAYLERVTLFTNILTFLVVIVAVYFKLSLPKYFLIHIMSTILIYPILLFKIKSIVPDIKILPGWNKEVFKEVLGYSMGIFLMGIFQFSVRNLRPIIVGAQSGIGSVTDYKIIESIANIIVLMSGSFLGILLPYATRVRTTGNREAQDKIIYLGTKYLSIFLSYIIFSLILVSNELLILYVGEDYLHLSIWLSIWLISILGDHTATISSLVLADANIKPLTYYTMASSTTAMILAWFATPYLKVGGVVIAFSSYVIMQTLFLYLYYIPKNLLVNSKKLFLNSFLSPVAIGATAFCLISLFFRNIDLDIYYKIAFKEIIFSVTFLIIIFQFLIDKQQILKFIKNRKG